MYAPKMFAVTDRDAIHGMIAAHGIAMIAAVDGVRPVIGYAPLVLEPAKGAFGAVSFHLAKGNRLVDVLKQDGEVVISLLGDNAYVSPDWYESEGMVPTWNYVAAELEGRARVLSDTELRAQLDALSAVHEARLAPKPPWTTAKVSAEKLDAMLTMIAGFEVVIDRASAKHKLAQNRNAVDHAGVVRGLEARGDAASLAIAARMKAR